MHVPGEGVDETRALEEPSRSALSTDESSSDSGAEVDSDSDGPVGLDAIDAVGVQGPPRAGQIFFGRYHVERQIGEGGMGTVWLVRHLELDAPRALKLIVSGIAFDPRVRARFRREARAMARLTHPNAVTVHDARIGREAAFIEMEYIRGQSLNKLITSGVPMPLDWIARIVEQLCDVLQEAHDRRIVHRDLKPSNLMLLDGRSPGKEHLKVLDFGIAKLLENETEADSLDVMTGTGCFLGSAPWSSPEQASGTEIDGRSDLYSVGIILYELLTGFRPFHGPLVRVVYDHIHTPPPRFATINPAVSVPAAVEQVVLRCLAKSPADRPQTAQDLAAEFLWAVTDENGTSSLAGAPPPPSWAADPARTEADPNNSLAEGAPIGGLPQSVLVPTEPAGTLPVTERQTAASDGWGEPATGQSEELLAATLAGDPRGDRSPRRHASIVEEDDRQPSRPRNRLWIACALAFLGVMLVIGGWTLWSTRSGGNPPEGYQAQGWGDGERLPAILVRKSDGTWFLRIPGGTFTMGNSFDTSGSEADEDVPAHPVLLSDFYLQETEVTNGEMDAYFLAQKIDRSRRPVRFQEAWVQIDKLGFDPRRYPAVGVTHAVADDYARWVGGRLPTEAQWEFAARSCGKPNRYVWETDEKPSVRNANIASMGENPYLNTSEVGKYKKDKTEQGIYDLTGNVREWCRDRWAKYKASEVPLNDPEGPDPSNAGALNFVIRGGSFSTFADQFRTTRPRRVERDDRTGQQLAEDKTADDLGFRVVIEWPRKSR